ncbi:hypothetical protein HOY82DRAFT_646392 [Tuber indicum]|nr:hypothetical protein HOY82DRAFT_646392 [Tuber indicum]
MRAIPPDGQASCSLSAFQLPEQALAEKMAQLNGVKPPWKRYPRPSPILPANISSVKGALYTTTQTLIRQVAFTLSDKLFAYSPDTFSLDTTAKLWSGNGQTNVRRVVPTVNGMETRLGAANVLLGYLTFLPLIVKCPQRDWSLTVSAVTVAQETSVGLLASFSTHEAQHMALFATLVATVLPMVHIYDGISMSRESSKIKDALDQASLQNVFSSILEEQKEAPKNADQGAKVNAVLRSLGAELGTAYSLFEYEGYDEPGAVLVTFGSVKSLLATQITASVVESGEKIGVIDVRVYKPFSESHFLEALPKIVKRVAVLGQVSNRTAAEDSAVQSALYVDVVAAITMSDIWSIGCYI